MDDKLEISNLVKEEKHKQSNFVTRNRLGNGINLLITNPFKEGGYNKIFKEQAPFNDLPLSWTENQRGSSTCTISEMTVELSAFYEVDDSVGKNGGAFRDYVRAQISLDMHKSNKYLMHRYHVIHKSPYLELDTYTMNDLEPQFLKDCENLSKDTALYFFNRWGTHYVKTIYKEASFFLWSKFSSQNSSMSGSMKAEIKSGIENGIISSMTSGEVSASIRKSLKSVNIEFAIEAHCNKECPIHYNDMLRMLGEEGSYGEAKQKEFDQWLKELRKNAVENYYDFRPIYNLPHFDEEQREHMMDVYKYYLENQWRFVEIVSGSTEGQYSVNASIDIHGSLGNTASHKLQQKGYVFITAVQNKEDGLRLDYVHSHERSRDHWKKGKDAQKAASSGFFFFCTSQWSDKEMRPDIAWLGGLVENTAYIDEWVRESGSKFRYVLAGKEGKLGQDRFTKDGNHKKILVLEARLGLNSDNQFELILISTRYIG